MSFEIVLGNRNITDSPEASGSKPIHNQPNIDSQINSNNVLLKNWNLCKFRSDPMETEITSCCNGTSKVICINCLKKGILEISPVICSICKVAELKEEESI